MGGSGANPEQGVGVGGGAYMGVFRGSWMPLETGLAGALLSQGLQSIPTSGLPLHWPGPAPGCMLDPTSRVDTWS